MSAEAKKATLARRVDEDITLIYPRTLADIVLTNDTNVTVQDKINAFQNDIARLNSDIGDINTSITSLSSKIDNLDATQIVMGNSDSGSVYTRFIGIDDRITSLNADSIKYNNTGSETIKSHIENLNTGNIIYSGDTKLSSKLGSIDGDISSINTNISSLQSNILSLQSGITKINSIINTKVTFNEYTSNDILFSDSYKRGADVNGGYMFLKGDVLSIGKRPILFKIKEACFKLKKSYIRMYSSVYSDMFKYAVQETTSSTEFAADNYVCNAYTRVIGPGSISQCFNDPVLAYSSSEKIDCTNISCSISNNNSNGYFNISITTENDITDDEIYCYMYAGGGSGDYLAELYFI